MIFPYDSLEYAAVCEAFHFLFSASVGFSVWSLTSTTSSSEAGRGTSPPGYVRWSSLLLASASALAVHVTVDWWGAF